MIGFRMAINVYPRIINQKFLNRKTSKLFAFNKVKYIKEKEEFTYEMG